MTDRYRGIAVDRGEVEPSAFELPDAGPGDAGRPCYLAVAPTKICEQCGGQFERRKNEGRRQYEARRFCTRSCADLNRKPLLLDVDTDCAVIAPSVSDLAAGMAGEHLVMADLLLQGYRAILAEQHCPYDVVVDLGSRLFRLQVKSARQASSETRKNGGVYTPAYVWGTRKAGKRGQRKYTLDGFDGLALVALDIRRIAYLPWTGQQHTQIPAPGTTALPAGNGSTRRARRDFDALTFAAAVSE